MQNDEWPMTNEFPMTKLEWQCDCADTDLTSVARNALTWAYANSAHQSANTTFELRHSFVIRQSSLDIP